MNSLYPRKRKKKLFLNLNLIIEKFQFIKNIFAGKKYLNFSYLYWNKSFLINANI